MIYITGDKHGNFNSFLMEGFEPNSSFICLGDSGINYFLDKKENNKKKELNNLGYKFYLIRGNHEARPQTLPNIIKAWNYEICGSVYYEFEYPNIIYLIDGEEYIFNNHKCLIIGGAYSVDKYYRLACGYQWFKDEQLSIEEQDKILNKVSGKNYDFIFSHTCPYEWRPTDLFLSSIDQTSVNNSMELFLSDIIKNVNFKLYCFGHYHTDRKERKNVYQLYHNIIPLEDLWESME